MEQYHETILVVEDDVQIRNFICYALKAEGFTCLTAGNAASAMKLLLSSQQDMILLDLGLPDRDGIEVIQTLRSWSRMPIIVISARSEDRDKIDALDAGADDYLVKPFSFEELSARIRVLLRRTAQEPVSNLLQLADLTMDLNTRRVARGDREITLSQKEYAVLEYLLRNQGAVLTRDQIEQHVWSYDFEGGSNVVDVYIRYVRKKIDTGYGQKLIHTVRGVGYVLKAE